MISWLRTRAVGALRGSTRSVRALAQTKDGRLLLGVVAVLVCFSFGGLLVLWPYGGSSTVTPTVSADSERAEVLAISSEGCSLEAGRGCRRLTVRLETGVDEGSRQGVTLPKDELIPDVEVGDTIRVQSSITSGIDPDLQRRLPEGGLGEDTYVFVEFERRGPILALAIVFAAVAVFFGRRKGALSLIGLGLALLLVVEFIVPAILAGKSPVAVALVGSLAVMLLTIPLAHGVGVTSLAAVLGSAGALLLTALLAVIMVGAAHVTGLSSEEATLLRGASGGQLSPEGLVLAGMVIGTLGVLDDVTVSQASTVLALQKADPDQSRRTLYGRAIGVGRDHLGATINTLVLAYAGAALPVLLVFSTQDTGIGQAINRENVAEEVVAMLVGSLGLLMAVPLTTALAAALATRLPQQLLPSEGHAH